MVQDVYDKGTKSQWLKFDSLFFSHVNIWAGKVPVLCRIIKISSPFISVFIEMVHGSSPPHPRPVSGEKHWGKGRDAPFLSRREARSCTHVFYSHRLNQQSPGCTKLQWTQENTVSVEMPCFYANILLADFYSFVLKLLQVHCKNYVWGGWLPSYTPKCLLLISDSTTLTRTGLRSPPIRTLSTPPHPTCCSPTSCLLSGQQDCISFELEIEEKFPDWVSSRNGFPLEEKHNTWYCLSDPFKYYP